MRLMRGLAKKASKIPAHKSLRAVVGTGPIADITGTARAAPSWTLSIEPIASNSGGTPRLRAIVGPRSAIPTIPPSPELFGSFVTAGRNRAVEGSHCEDAENPGGCGLGAAPYPME